MVLVNLFRNRYYDFYEYIRNLSYLNVPETYIIGGILSIIVTILWALLRRKTKINEDEAKSLDQSSANVRPRFRKRDKLYFFGRKVLRKVRGSISTDVKSKKLYRMLSNRILNRKNKDSMPQLSYRNEPPQFLLDFDSTNPDHKLSQHLPTALINLIRSVKVFGYLDQKIILEMCKYMETKIVYAGNYLFKIGDPDDSIYVVESGRINVYITDEKGHKHLIKECTEGSHVFSLLSVMDVLTGDPKPYKTVSAKAVEDTSILRLPGKAFVEVLQKFPESLVRITQIIMVRLQRVTFTALHNYLGLTSEIMRVETKKTKPGDKARHHHHHHHKHHHHHNKHAASATESNKKATLETVDENKNGDENNSESESSASEIDIKKITRQFSIPLPPISLFVDKNEPQSPFSFKTHHPAHDLKAQHFFHESFNTHNEDLTSTTTNNKNNDDNNENPLSSKSSSCEEIDSDGSEFGQTLSNNKLNEMLPEVEEKIARLLNLEDTSLLKDKITIMSISEGTVLNKESDTNSRLIYIIKGLIFATRKDLDLQDSVAFLAYPNEFCGSLSVLTGEPSQFTYTAQQPTDIAFLTKEHFHQLLSVQPTIVLPVANMIVRRMSPFVRQIDFSLEWNLIESGVSLFRQNQKAENIYIVLNGRLRSILTTNTGSKQLVGEYGRSDLVGIVETLLETNHATTVMAIRDTEVAQIPSGLLNYIKYRHPRVVSRLIKLLSSKLLGNMQNMSSSPFLDSNISIRQPIDAPTIVSNLCTVAILPVSEDVPLDTFTLELYNALDAIDNTLLLTKELILKNLGPSALERVNEYRLSAWLGSQEDHHRIVLYQCEKKLTPWTRRCMRQADCLLIIGTASNPPTVGVLEKEIENIAIRAQKELVLLHRIDGPRPKNTVNWLTVRGWCTSHHHVRCPKSLFTTNEANLKNYYNNLKSQPIDRFSDFSRLARFLTGTSVGLVLGGGGARGCAHVGVIKALKEAGIPIDMIGGTSIGSFMGALYAEVLDVDIFDKRANEWALKMTSYGRQIMDLTYPVTSMFTGHQFNKTIEEVFCDRQIEDLWIPYFCITTDISSSQMRVHTSGVVWRYIRASMSLSGYFAPICDPADGHLLLDGGYVNNLPADVMHRMGINIVLAVDVGSRDDLNFTNYGDTLSGWWLLWKKWNRWAAPVKVPDLTEIQSRLAYVSCQRQLEIVKSSSYCEYLRPPIDKYRTLQFASYEEIKNCGYEYASMLTSMWNRHDGSFDKYLERKYYSTGITLKKRFKEASVNDKQRHNSLKPDLIFVKDTKKSFKFDDLSQFVTQTISNSVSNSASSCDIYQMQDTTDGGGSFKERRKNRNRKYQRRKSSKPMIDFYSMLNYEKDKNNNHNNNNEEDVEIDDNFNEEEDIDNGEESDISESYDENNDSSKNDFNDDKSKEINNEKLSNATNSS